MRQALYTHTFSILSNKRRKNLTCPQLSQDFLLLILLSDSQIDNSRSSKSAEERYWKAEDGVHNYEARSVIRPLS